MFPITDRISIALLLNMIFVNDSFAEALPDEA